MLLTKNALPVVFKSLTWSIVSKVESEWVHWSAPSSPSIIVHPLLLQFCSLKYFELLYEITRRRINNIFLFQWHSNFDSISIAFVYLINTCNTILLNLTEQKIDTSLDKLTKLDLRFLEEVLKQYFLPSWLEF